MHLHVCLMLTGEGFKDMYTELSPANPVPTLQLLENFSFCGVWAGLTLFFHIFSMLLNLSKDLTFLVRKDIFPFFLFSVLPVATVTCFICPRSPANSWGWARG